MLKDLISWQNSKEKIFIYYNSGCSILVVLHPFVSMDSYKYVSKAMKLLPTSPQNEKDYIYLKFYIDF